MSSCSNQKIMLLTNRFRVHPVLLALVFCVAGCKSVAPPHENVNSDPVNAEPSKTPEDAVRGYLFALRDWDFHRAYTYEFEPKSTQQQYVDDMVGLEWRVIQFQVHRVEIETTDSAKVIVGCLTYSEGELSIDRMDFAVRRSEDHWLVDGYQWGSSVPVPIPEDWRTKLKLD